MTGVVSGPPWDQAFEDLVRAALPEPPRGGGLGADLDLVAAGLDSMRMVRLLMSLEDSYDVVIPDELLEFSEYATPMALWLALVGARDEH